MSDGQRGYAHFGEWRGDSFVPNFILIGSHPGQYLDWFSRFCTAHRCDQQTHKYLLAVPRFRLNTYGRRAFSVADALAWNSLV